VINARASHSKEHPTVVAKHILVDGGADVWIDMQSTSWLQITDLELTDSTTLGIVTDNNDNFTISM